MRLLPANVTATVGAVNSDGSIAVIVTTDALALYVTLTTTAQGRFSDNSFDIQKGTHTVRFLPFEANQTSTLKASLRVEHLALYR